MRLGVGSAAGLGAGLDDDAVIGEPADDRGARPGVGEGARPIAERVVRGDRDARSFLALGQHLEEQLRAALVEFEVLSSPAIRISSQVDLYRDRDYAERAANLAGPDALEAGQLSA